MPTTESARAPVVRVSSLTKKYADVTALDDVTVDFAPGVAGLVGANGAGKSTLMKILLGLIEPTSGSAEVFGLDVATESLPIRELVGYMPEHDCLPTDQSATQFVLHLARMSGLPATAARERTAETLRHVGLYEERYRHIGGYSTGMKQRVKLAQALVHDPKLLFLDEPTNGLDPSGRENMLGLIERTGSTFGISVIMSSHVLSEIESVCDSLVLIDGGHLTRSGSLSDFTGSVSVLMVEVDRDTDVLLARLLERGMSATTEGRAIAIPMADVAPEPDPDAERALHRRVLAEVADLGLPLVGMSRQRHTLGELFHDDAPPPGTVGP